MIAISCFWMMHCGSRKDGDSETVLQGKDHCAGIYRDDCSALAGVIEQSREEQKKVQATGNLLEATRLGLEIHHAMMLRNLYSSGYAKETLEVQREGQKHQTALAILTSAVTPDTASPPCQEPSHGLHCQDLRDNEQLLVNRYQSLTDYASAEALNIAAELNYIKLKQQLSDQAFSPAAADLEGAYASVLITIAMVERRMMPDQSGQGICPEAFIAKCQTLMAQIHQLRTERDQALQKGDSAAYQQSTINLDFREDLLASYVKGLDDESTYVKALNKQFHDWQRFEQGRRFQYSEKEQIEIAKVKNLYGDLFLSLKKNWTSLVLGGRKPWSGYWYPFRSADMFDGQNSASFASGETPLEQFDRLLSAQGRTPGAAAWEAAKQKSSSWETSDGFCDAWSTAAILTPEPRKAVTIGDVTFSPAQIKALLVQTYTNFPKDRFGLPYRGYIDTDGLAQDLRPEAFHLLMVNMLKAGQTPIVDTDPNFPIWNMPLFRYDWKIEQDPQIANAFLIVAQPWYIKFRAQEDAASTNYTIGSGSHLYLPTYKYRLYYDPDDAAEEKRILYGEWILDQIATEYPDTVYKLDANQEPKPRNPFVANNRDLITQILNQLAL